MKTTPRASLLSVPKSYTICFVYSIEYGFAEGVLKENIFVTSWGGVVSLTGKGNLEIVNDGLKWRDFERTISKDAAILEVRLLIRGEMIGG
jgi:hypothetical protein